MTVPSPSDDHGRSLGHEVDQLCDEFEAAWKRGIPQSIEHLLDRSSLSVRPRLLRELLHLDLEYRRRRGESPQTTTYAVRFPQHESIVAEVFREFAASAETKPAVNSESPGAIDENLLLGILALQMDFVSREQYIVAMLAWVKDKSRSLQQIFRQQGVLRDDTIQLLSALVAKHLALQAKESK